MRSSIRPSVALRYLVYPDRAFNSVPNFGDTGVV